MAHHSQSKRVLIVDDEPNVAVVLADSLEKLGDDYIIETASSGERALEKIRQHPYDLVVTDYKMPGLSGLDVAREVRQVSPETQVILMTAYGTAGLRDAVERMDMSYIDKPFTMEQIREIVERVVGYPETRRDEDPYRSGARALAHPVIEHLRALQADTGARCVLLLSTGGYPVETVGQTVSLDVNSVGALVAANFLAAAELARLLGNRTVFKSSYHEGPDYNVYAYDVNGELLLAVVFGAESKPGVVWFYTKQTAAALTPLLADLVAPVELAADLTTAMNAQWDQLIGGGSPDGAGALLSLQEAIAAGLVPADLADAAGR